MRRRVPALEDQIMAAIRAAGRPVTRGELDMHHVYGTAGEKSRALTNLVDGGELVEIMAKGNFPYQVLTFYGRPQRARIPGGNERPGREESDH